MTRCRQARHHVSVVHRGQVRNASITPTLVTACHSTVQFHRCVPVQQAKAALEYGGSRAASVWSDLVSDMSQAWRVIVYMCLFAAGACPWWGRVW